jgi:hypothetical protein
LPDSDSDNQGDSAYDDSTQNSSDDQSSAGSPSAGGSRSGRANGILKGGAFGRKALRSKSPGGSKVTFQGSARQGSAGQGSAEVSNQGSTQESREGLRQNSSSNLPDPRSQSQDSRIAPASLGRLGGNLKMGGDGLTIGEKMMNAQGISIIPGAGGSRSNSTLGGGSDDRRVRFDLSGSRSQGQSRADGSQNRDTNRHQDVSQQVAQVISATRGGNQGSSGDGWTPASLIDSVKFQSPINGQQNAQNFSAQQKILQDSRAIVIDAGGGVGPQEAMGGEAGSDSKSRSQGNQVAVTSQQNPKVVKKINSSKKTSQVVDEFTFEDDSDNDGNDNN